MTIATGGTHHETPARRALYLAALLGGNFALALGPWFVREADCGPVSAGFWRLALALPLLVLLARANGQQLLGLSRRTLAMIAGAGLFFSLDLASWHIGIGLTRLGNATLFGNSGSLIVMAWGLVALHRKPHWKEWTAMFAAISGATILLGRSLEIGRTTLIGDLFCLLAGGLYVGYILLAQHVRASLGGWTVLVWASLAGLPVLLTTALLRGETVLPHNWLVVIGLAMSSQVIGQGLLVFSMRHFPPLVIGLALLTQPAVSVAVGWLAFNEVLSPLDGFGMVLVAMALVLARGAQPAAKTASAVD